MEAVLKEFRGHEDSEVAEHHLRFFKTGPGEYGEGDVFIGVRVPMVRQVASNFKDLDNSKLNQMLDHEIHEVRQCALFIMVKQFKSSNKEVERKTIFKLYMKKAKEGKVNNWDLVDGSAHHIVGGFLQNRDRKLLLTLADENKLWLQRIAVIATFRFIEENDFEDALLVAEKLVHHEHDLIHKAVGWMLREIGNRDRAVEENFLNQYYKSMPRTMLRYAIEKFPKSLRQKYLLGHI
jgi:3-methyladenine DNA glycosylase AlkD